MDILEHLTHEHRKTEELLAALAESDPGKKRTKLLDDLEESLATHMAVEEEFLYPIVAETLGKEDRTEANIEHDLARDGLGTLRALADKPGFGAALDMVSAGIAHHVREEEEEMFPKLRKAAARALESLDPEALEAVAGATRAQLYEQARQAGIEGRSHMSRAELADALAGLSSDR